MTIAISSGSWSSIIFTMDLSFKFCFLLFSLTGMSVELATLLL